MTNKRSIESGLLLPVALLLVTITTFIPLRVEAVSIDVATPEFLRGETRPKSVALLPPQGLNQEFETEARDHLTSILNGKGYKTKTLTVEQVNADSQLQELVLRANQRVNVGVGVLRRIKWLGTRKKKVSQRQVNLGADVSSLASKLKVDGAVFGRISYYKSGNVAVLWIDVGVANGATGDLEAYFYEQVLFWSSPKDAMDKTTQALSENLPAVDQVIKAKGSTLKASAKSPKDKDATIAELETLVGKQDPPKKGVTTARPTGTTTTTGPDAAPPTTTAKAEPVQKDNVSTGSSAGDAVRGLFAGNTSTGTTSSGNLSWWMYTRSDNTTVGRLSNGDMDVGTWRISKEGWFCRTWKRWVDGKEGCWQVELKKKNKYKLTPKAGIAHPYVIKILQGNAKNL